jgi:pimeloyl-ACP methyl ester carboxylesterase
MHDWLGDHMNYDLTLPFWDYANYTWIFVDLRGYGLSKHISGDFTCGEATLDVVHLAEHLGFDGFHVVGHSMSSMVAQSIAACVPNRVMSVIAVTPIPASGVSLLPEVEGVMKIIATDCFSLFEKDHAGVHGTYKDPWLESRLRFSSCSSSSKAMAGYLKMFTGTDFSAEAAGLSVPVRVIVGEHDIPVFQRQAVHDAFNKLYPDFQIVECQESGHYPMIQYPALFVSKVEKFLRDLRMTDHCGQLTYPRQRELLM